MLSWRSIGFPADLSFSFLGCSFRFSQSALFSVFCGPEGSFPRYPHIVGLSVFENDGLSVFDNDGLSVFDNDGLSAIVTVLLFILMVGVTVL